MVSTQYAIGPKGEKRIYVGETIRLCHPVNPRWAEDLDYFNYESPALFWEMKKKLGDMAPLRAEYMKTGRLPKIVTDHFDFIISETKIVDSRSESRALEKKWKTYYQNQGFTLLNGRLKKATLGCPITAATRPVVSTQTKTYTPFANARQLRRGQRVLYRWPVGQPGSDDYDRTQIERLGLVESTNHSKYIAIEPIAPLSKYATEWILPEDVLGLVPEK